MKRFPRKGNFHCFKDKFTFTECAPILFALLTLGNFPPPPTQMYAYLNLLAVASHYVILWRKSAALQFIPIDLYGTVSSCRRPPVIA